MTYMNLLGEFINLKTFLLEKGIAWEGGKGEEELVFEEGEL